MSLDIIKSDLAAKISKQSIKNDDAALIIRYISELKAENSLSDKSVTTEYDCLLPWTKYLSLSKATIQDIHSAKAELDNRGLKQNTMMNYVAHMKRFFRWAIEQGHPIDLVKLNKIKTPGIDRMTKTADDMLTEEEVQSIYMASGRVRDRAMFSMMYEGGFRPVDLYELQWGRVQFNDHNVVINTNAKVGERPRRVPLFKCRGYLVQWHDDYPGKPVGDNYVFVSLREPHEPIGYRGMQTAFHRAVRLSGIDKKKSMYFFRHSHVTHLQEQGVSDAVNKLTHWGSQGTNMLATYSHLSNDHVDQVLAEHAGIKPKEKKKLSSLKAIQCPKCATVNPPEANRCYICGAALSDDAKSQDMQAKDLLQDPDVLAALLEISRRKKQERENRG